MKRCTSNRKWCKNFSFTTNQETEHSRDQASDNEQFGELRLTRSKPYESTSVLQTHDQHHDLTKKRLQLLSEAIAEMT